MSNCRVQHCTALILVLVSSGVSSGCLISPPADVDSPERIPPSVFMDQVVPSLLKPVRTYRDAALNEPFTAPYVSEDLGEAVWGRLYLDYNGASTTIIGAGERAGSTLDNKREMVIEWTESLNRPAGCHSITMAISHSSNFGFNGLPIDNDETAFVTWWVSHDSEFQDVTLYDCNETSVTTP